MGAHLRPNSQKKTVLRDLVHCPRPVSTWRVEPGPSASTIPVLNHHVLHSWGAPRPTRKSLPIYATSMHKSVSFPKRQTWAWILAHHLCKWQPLWASGHSSLHFRTYLAGFLEKCKVSALSACQSSGHRVRTQKTCHSERLLPGLQSQLCPSPNSSACLSKWIIMTPCLSHGRYTADASFFLFSFPFSFLVSVSKCFNSQFAEGALLGIKEKVTWVNKILLTWEMTNTNLTTVVPVTYSVLLMCHWILTMAPWGRYFHPYFTDEETR